MFIIDFSALAILSYLVVRRLGVIDSPIERMALAILITFGLKSLILLGLILLKIQPNIATQTYISLGGLALIILLQRNKFTQIPFQEKTALQGTWQRTVSIIILATLFIVSAINAFFFPIYEADPLWNQIQAIRYFHEMSFDTAQFHTLYPPYINMLFTYFVSLDWERMRSIFPIYYLCLLVIFYHRVYANARNQKLAAVFTLLLGSTPYLWWHSVLPFLNLTAGTHFSLGLIYWFFCIRQLHAREDDASVSASISFALLSGVFFGLASWTRLEFCFYGLFPFLTLMLILINQSKLNQTEKNKILLAISLPMLGLPSIWLIILSSFYPFEFNIQGIAIICAFMWVLTVTFLFGIIKLQIDRKRFWVLACFTVVLFLVVLALKGPKSIPLVYSLTLGVFRTILPNIYYSFTLFIAFLLFYNGYKSLTSAEKLMGGFLLFYIMLHYAIYTITPPKWNNVASYIDANLFHPGTTVNASPTREKIAFYPILIFFISCLPRVKRGFE